MSLDVGSTYTAAFNVTNASGTGVDPATATLTITKPDQTTTVVPSGSLLPTPQANGQLRWPFVPALPGLFQFTWVTTSPALTKTDYENFTNYRSAISLQSARDRIGSSATTNDERLRLYCAAATRVIERRVGTIVPVTITDEVIPGTYKDALRVARGPILALPGTGPSYGVTALSSVYPSGPSWQCGGPSNIITVTPMPGVIREIGLIPFWYGPWKCSYTAGQTADENITESIKEVVFDLYNAVRGLTADLTESAQLDALVASPYYKLPPRALSLIHGYELPGFG